MSTPTPTQPISPVEEIDSFVGGKMRAVLNRIEAIHHRKTGGYCDAGRSGTDCTGASCDITAAATHLPRAAKHTVEQWIRTHQHTTVHTVEVAVAGPNRAWQNSTVNIDDEHSFTLTTESGYQKRYGVQHLAVLASDQETLLVSDGYEMALFVVAGSGARYAQQDHEHSERMRALR